MGFYGSNGNPSCVDVVEDAGQKVMTNPCWDGYTQVGMKMKNGKKVPNCVPEKGVPKAKKKPVKKAGKK